MNDFYQGRAWIELDRAALRHNAALLQARTPPGCVLMPALKANAYGHGAVLIARELNALGINAFCVATASEGAELRQAGTAGEILVLGYTHPREFPLLGQYRLTQTVLDLPYALELDASPCPVHVHVKIDTGMHRLGERWENLAGLRRIFECSQLRVTGAYTHLYADDLASPDGRAAALEQSRAFFQTTERLREMGCSIPKVHLLASEGLLHCPEIGGDFARVGIALYGLLSTKEDWVRSGGGLRPVLTLKARIALVKQLRRGEGAGYGHQFRAVRDTRLAVAAVGYADGLPRALSNGVGAALVRGRRAPVAGRVCMDQVLLDVTDIPGVAAGDAAVFIGGDRQGGITACDVAEQCGTIANEVVSRLGARLERCWGGP